MFKTYAIYFPNGKLYIGYTKNALDYRLNEHFKRPMGILKYAVPKYKDALNICLLGEFETKAEALEHEQLLIDRYNTQDILCGYNLTKGGENPPASWNGRHWMHGKTPEEIKAINQKKARPGKSNPFYGKTHSTESMKKMVAKRRINGSYDIASCSIPIIYEGKEYPTKSHMRKATGIGRVRQNSLINQGKATLKVTINSQGVI